MEFGEVVEVTHGACEDLYLVETGMYDVSGYGGAYILNAERPAIVETGIGTHHDRILDALSVAGLSPGDIEVIAVTHVHLDHAGGAGFLAQDCQEATVVAHEIGAPHLANPDALVAGTKRAVGDQWTHYTVPEPIPEERIESISDGDVVDLGDHRLAAARAPGHAPHQVVYHDPAIDAVFTGDAAGLWIPEREAVRQTTPPPQFDLEQAVIDLDRIRECDPQTLLYTHFGPAPYSEELLTDYETTLRSWVQDVERKYEELGDADAVAAHFAEQADLDRVWSARRAEAEMRLNVAGVLRYLAQERAED